MAARLWRRRCRAHGRDRRRGHGRRRHGLGIIPELLVEREVRKDITELVVSRGMFDRKERMIAESDAYVTMPGGLGTIDRLFELTLKQLGYHASPILLLDRNGYWQSTMAMIGHVVDNGFADPSAPRAGRMPA
ncbi:MAG: LOG family protein [Geminicoccaceae bacterium]